ncbi:hypothetical protein CEXT_74871 [Caerostris extrusa]|uniref:Uncharacterized protein n=1 Tax=Caerostris extrusa TaxID=172846 RepID=A0AAV4S749_CAEEX|nr:hypothetical protein CEXT_74871 [Caerostris extrusa]
MNEMSLKEIVSPAEVHGAAEEQRALRRDRGVSGGPYLLPGSGDPEVPRDLPGDPEEQARLLGHQAEDRRRLRRRRELLPLFLPSFRVKRFLWWTFLDKIMCDRNYCIDCSESIAGQLR